VLDLSGTWRFALDPEDRGVAAAWWATRLPEEVRLPGTTDENGKGTPEEAQRTRLTRVCAYRGAAWYQRDVEVPFAWAGRRAVLTLERSKATRVWVDGRDGGGRDSVSTAQVYDLTDALPPGRHVLTIRVDNGPGLPAGGHATSEDTQTDWNGILGRIDLQATDRVWIDDVQVYLDVARRFAQVRLRVGNATGAGAEGTLTLRAALREAAQPHDAPPVLAPFRCGPEGAAIEAEVDMGPAVRLWDEFTPVVYRLAVALDAGVHADAAARDFGLRAFTAEGTQFRVNGRAVFLRGKHDGCVFPLTGHPPMDEAAWVRLFRIARDYGVNHYRFHSWCPPEAAFAAADRVGIYLQPELPNWRGRFAEPARGAYMAAEGERILDAYGNHPSFVMFALGNELVDRSEVLGSFVDRFRARDPRHLYAQGSNYRFGHPRLAEGDDFWVTCQTSGLWGGDVNRTRFGWPVRGSFDRHDRGHVNNLPPSTEVDYRRAISAVPVPVVGHEIGQYCVYPNLAEIERYTGVVRARNFEAVRDHLAAQGMGDQAGDFVAASGALAVLCYREEIEAALRTPGFGGFQVLDLQDYPGQGTALVGILDAFMASKGLITPEGWRAFCGETVPLLRFPRYTWCADETFRAEAQVAHYGPEAWRAVPVWSVADEGGAVLAAGELPEAEIPQGAVTPLGEIVLPLGGLVGGSPAGAGGSRPPAGRRLRLTLSLGGTPYANAYDIWVYPPYVDLSPPAGVTVSRMLDARTRQALAEGGRVVLLPTAEVLGPSVAGAFQPDFWCFSVFRRQDPPGTLGLLCHPEHPALEGFPTAFHSDWQWWHLVRHTPATILDAAPAGLRPIVQTIDNSERNHRLGLVWECRVTAGARRDAAQAGGGEGAAGRLLVCNIPLPDLLHLPEARQLLAGLFAYAASDRFAPAVEMSMADSTALVHGRGA